MMAGVLYGVTPSDPMTFGARGDRAARRGGVRKLGTRAASNESGSAGGLRTE